MKREDKILIVLIAILAMAAIFSTVRRACAEAIITAEAEMIAKVMYEECRGVKSETRKAAVAWCVLNRVDHPNFPDTIEEVVTDEYQFAWNPNAPVTDELLTLAKDVLLRWELEKLGVGDVGRVLPEKYLFFASDGNGENRFRAAFEGGRYWDWSLDSPYEE